MLLKLTKPCTVAGIILIGGMILMSGCIFDPEKYDGGGITPTVDRTTPQKLLEFFAFYQATPNTNLEEYGRALHTNFTFWFTQEDADEIRSGDPLFPGFWTKEEDQQATENMFGAATGIAMTLTAGDEFPPEPCEPGGPECRIFEVTVDLTVDIPGEPEGTTYLVQGFANIAVTADPFDPALWVIYSILDRTNEGLGGAPPIIVERSGKAPSGEVATWGEIRNLLSEAAD